MITRKENLLLKPFQQKKYVEHRTKVNTALPKIDDKTPPQRSHVYIKCKKLQTEDERQNQIARDNFILLRHLSDIMTTKRIDNTWTCELPKFQHRIKLFHNRSTKIHPNKIPPIIEAPKRSTLKEKCIACNPDMYINPVHIPEDRVPWEIKPIREFNLVDIQVRKRNPKGIMTTNSAKEVKERKITIPDIKIHQSHKREQKSHPFKCRCRTAPQLQPKEKHRNTCFTENIQGNNRPLTVVMKFPSTTNVKLDAGLRP